MNLKRPIKQIFALVGNLLTAPLHERATHANKQLDYLMDRDREHTTKIDRLAEANVAILKSTIDTFMQIEELSGQFENFSKLTENQIASLNKKLPGHVEIASKEYASVSPESILMTYLYSYLDSRVALDVGAHCGDVSRQLAETGFVVHAFEPNTKIQDNLKNKLENLGNCTIHNYALGSNNENASLIIYDNLPYSRTHNDPSLLSSLLNRELLSLQKSEHIEVVVETISNLVENKELPSNIGLLKIDTEGYDLEVIKGMGELRPSIVVAEYWDKDHPWGQNSTLYTYRMLIDEMRDRDYNWHIDLHRLWGEEKVCFTSNQLISVPNSWGNIFFFNDIKRFHVALQWCEATLPRTFFKSETN
ncbi:MAG: hypothetical protein DHS20C17_31110 [Cyclobacteriaceae bacterium]|nr:MAG: hypothetical protein DHS20C17_31110 [Cyclobacteriaceae bacterium]